MNENEQTGELPLLTAGQQLREAREAQKLSFEAIASQTKIATRQLEAIEQDRFSDLASRTYAIGFSRAYARALGLDEKRIADKVRAQMDAEDGSRPASNIENFEPGDPARVPPSLLAWGAGLALLGVIVVLFLFWRSYVDPAGQLPDLVSDEDRAKAQPSAVPSVSPSAAVAQTGPVVVTATEDRVWVKIVDDSGMQIFQKEMTQGEAFTIPADVSAPALSTARSHGLRISVGGKEVPQLSAGGAVLRNLPVDAASLSVRLNAPGANNAAVTPAAAPTAGRPNSALPRVGPAAPVRSTPSAAVPAAPQADAGADAAQPMQAAGE